MTRVNRLVVRLTCVFLLVVATALYLTFVLDDPDGAQSITLLYIALAITLGLVAR